MEHQLTKTEYLVTFHQELAQYARLLWTVVPPPPDDAHCLVSSTHGLREPELVGQGFVSTPRMQHATTIRKRQPPTARRDTRLQTHPTISQRFDLIQHAPTNAHLAPRASGGVVTVNTYLTRPTDRPTLLLCTTDSPEGRSTVFNTTCIANPSPTPRSCTSMHRNAPLGSWTSCIAFEYRTGVPW